MKIFKIMMMALVAMCGLNSCSDDCNHDFIEVDYSKKLAGTWTCMEFENDFAEALIFNADGTVTSTGVFDEQFYEKKGTYQIKGNKMTLSYEDGDCLETRFEMVEGEVFSLVDDLLDVRYNYYYCENDLSDEIVGMWVVANGTPDMTIETYYEDGRSTFTGIVNGKTTLKHERNYKVVGDLSFHTTIEAPSTYVAQRLIYSPNATSYGDLMTWQLSDEFSFTRLRVKEGLNLTGKTYDYSAAYVTNAKGTDEDFTMLGHTFNMANINAGNFDMMFRSELFCVDLNANSITQRFRANGRDIEIEIPITVEGNKVTLDLSTENPAYREVDMYMFQDADDCQLHMYMHTDAFINYFANMELYNLLASGEITSDAAAVEKVFADMEARIESINVTFVMKVRK